MGYWCFHTYKRDTKTTHLNSRSPIILNMVWNKEEVNLLKKMYVNEKYNVWDICKKLHKSRRAISAKASRLGIRRPKTAHNTPENWKHREEYDKSYFKRNYNKILKYRKDKFMEGKKYLFNMLGNKCEMCGNTDYRVLDFHHKGNKKDSVVVVLKRNGLKKAIVEAKKCILLCANCHRIHHFEKK